jgi:hypothetical protein
MLETHAGPGKLIDNRRLIRFTAVTAETFIADIIGHYQHNIWLPGSIMARRLLIGI